MENKLVFFVTNKVADKINSADYQRLSLLTEHYSVVAVVNYPLPESLQSRVVAEVNPGGPIWILRAALEAARFSRSSYDGSLVYSGPGMYSILVSYLIWKKSRSRFLIDFWDHPSLGYSMARFPIKQAKSALWKLLGFGLGSVDAYIIAMAKGVETHLPKGKAVHYFLGRGFQRFEDGKVHRQELCESELRIVSVGWLYRTRGTDTLLSTLVELEAHGITATVKVAGLADSYSLALVEEHNKTHKNKVIYLGFLSANEVHELYNWGEFGLCLLDTNVLNYRYAYPIKIIEYMGEGVICLATRTRGSEAMIENGKNGFLFEDGPDAGAQIALTLSNLNKNQRLNVTSEGRRSLDKYNLPKHSSELLSIVKKVIG